MNKKYIQKFAVLSSLVFIAIVSVYGSFLLYQDSYINADDKSDTIKIDKLDSNNTSTSVNVSKSDELNILITQYLESNDIPKESISISIVDVSTSTAYAMNADVEMVSASLYKVPLAMLYYEYINDGSMSLQDTFVYSANCYEEGGPIGYTYQVGSAIPLEELLYNMIVYSDNTAAHILFEHLGGWEAFRFLIQKYSDNTYSSSFMLDNVSSASFGTDVLSYLYSHETSYSALIAHMKLVFPNDYLNKNLGISIAQKYGSYGTSENAMGIVYGKHPYLITVLTTLSTNGVQVIGDINEIAYNFYLES